MYKEEKTYFKRSDKLRSRLLSKEELNVYLSCRQAVQIRDLVSVTGLDTSQVKIILDNLVLEKLIVLIDHLDNKDGNSLKKPDATSGKTTAFYKLCEELESFLTVRLPSKKAKDLLRELLICSSEFELKITAKRLAKKIALLVDSNVGKEMLELIEKNNTLKVINK